MLQRTTHAHTAHAFEPTVHNNLWWTMTAIINRTKKATLSSLSDLAFENITVVITAGGDAACQDSATVNTTIAIDLDYGNYPLQVKRDVIWRARYLAAL